MAKIAFKNSMRMESYQINGVAASEITHATFGLATMSAVSYSKFTP